MTYPSTPRLMRAAAGTGLACLLLLSTTTRTFAAAPTAEEIIVKARTLLGTEKALSDITTIHAVGQTLDANGTVTGKVEYWFKKPGSQRKEFTSSAYTNIFATDGHEAWALSTENATARRTINILFPPQLGMIINESYENLFFYRGPSQRGGGSVVLDPATGDIEGKKTWKVIFRYPGSVNYVRYFDQTTGELVRYIAENQPQSWVVESKRGPYSGINLPTELQYFTDGKLVNTVKFTDIRVNDAMDDSLFAIPTPGMLMQMAAQPPVQPAQIAPLPGGDANAGVPPVSNSPAGSQPVTPIFQVK